MIRRGSAAGFFPVVLGALLLIIAAVAGAQETLSPTPSPTATPTATTNPQIDGEVGEEPASEPEPLDESTVAVEASPTPTLEPQAADEAGVAAGTEPTPTLTTEPASVDDPASTDEAELVVKTDEGTEIPSEPEQQFDLNPYPETAQKNPKEKWNTFKDGFRGLLVWDFFDSRLTIRAHARLQVDGTLARADDKMEQFTGELGNSIDLRRFQLFAQGTIDHHLRYSLSFNFGADAGFGDIFVEGREHGLNVFGYRVGQFRLGSFQEPFSF